ncbi:NTF2-like protein [Hypomontagnella monticulosa]|nr:NTF2-like protein [Hypomontagnella monticulosa]
MEFNIPRIVNAAMPDRGDKNIGIISSSSGPGHNDPGFLSNDFPRSPPKLYITSEDDEFDLVTLGEWRDEGFNVEYIPMGAGGNEYKMKIESLSRAKMDPCETFGIVAYGDAAGFCLEHFHVMDNNPEFRLSCLIAYYPTRIPDPRTKFPGGINVLVHLASGEEVGIVKQTQMVGIQGKKRVSRTTIDRGMGAGGTLQMAYPSYTYDATPGFAEHDLDEFDRVSAELSWSRSLATARRAFRKDVDLEKVMEENIQGKFYTRQLQPTMSTFSAHKSPHVTYIPTLTGGIGTEELRRFYSEFFIDRNPPSTKLILLSRTIGADRVVDELHVSFKHTQEMPWILPGVPPTNKKVDILVVSIVALRGGRLYHEHVYWDQASVLVQTGLLDPKVVPKQASEKGVKRLPVIGRQAARRVLRGYDDGDEGSATNELIEEWDDDLDDDDAAANGDKDTGGGKSKSAKDQQDGEDEEKPELPPRNGLAEKKPEQPSNQAQVEDETTQNGQE